MTSEAALRGTHAHGLAAPLLSWLHLHTPRPQWWVAGTLGAGHKPARALRAAPCRLRKQIEDAKLQPVVTQHQVHVPKHIDAAKPPPPMPNLPPHQQQQAAPVPATAVPAMPAMPAMPVQQQRMAVPQPQQQPAVPQPQQQPAVPQPQQQPAVPQPQQQPAVPQPQQQPAVPQPQQQPGVPQPQQQQQQQHNTPPAGGNDQPPVPGSADWDHWNQVGWQEGEGAGAQGQGGRAAGWVAGLGEALQVCARGGRPSQRALPLPSPRASGAQP